jgi:DNA-binding response OmpR family regulator
MDRPCVLIVEDDSSVREPLAKFLTLHGFDVLAAHSRGAARQLLVERQPDAAVIDLRLPEGSGLDIARAIPPPIPVIIFTAVPDESSNIEETRPNTRLVLKPFSLAMLAKLLQQMLASSP